MSTHYESFSEILAVHELWDEFEGKFCSKCGKGFTIGNPRVTSRDFMNWIHDKAIRTSLGPEIIDEICKHLDSYSSTQHASVLSYISKIEDKIEYPLNDNLTVTERLARITSSLIDQTELTRIVEGVNREYIASGSSNIVSMDYPDFYDLEVTARIRTQDKEATYEGAYFTHDCSSPVAFTSEETKAEFERWMAEGNISFDYFSRADRYTFALYPQRRVANREILVSPGDVLLIQKRVDGIRSFDYLVTHVTAKVVDKFLLVESKSLEGESAGDPE